MYSLPSSKRSFGALVIDAGRQVREVPFGYFHYPPVDLAHHALFDLGMFHHLGQSAAVATADYQRPFRDSGGLNSGTCVIISL
jgi:hypothetical protein